MPTCKVCGRTNIATVEVRRGRAGGYICKDKAVCKAAQVKAKEVKE